MQRLFLFLLLGFLSVASAQTTVTGRVTAADGKPMPMARVVLTLPESHKALESAYADRDGNFRIDIRSNGIWILEFSGVYHETYRVALYVRDEKAIKVDVHLKTLSYQKSFDDVKVVGDFNKWYVPFAVPMKRQPDGLYHAVIETKLDEIHYELMGVASQENVAGTDADGFAYDESRGYTAVLTAKGGKLNLYFNPEKLPRSDKPAGFDFTESSRVTSKFAKVYDEIGRWKREHAKALLNAMKRSVLERKRSSSVDFDFDGVLAEIDTQLSRETSTPVREELYLGYCRMAALAGPIDTALARSTLRKIPLSSIVWLLDPQVINYALQFSGYGEKVQREYIDKLLKENPSTEVKAKVLSVQFMYAKYMDQKEAARHYYRALLSEFGGTEEAQKTKRKFPNELALEIGDPVPAFSVVSLANSASLISNKTLKGKYYLMFFWMSTDRSCVREIASLKKAYRKLDRRNFEIVSLSLDRKLETTLKALHGREKMPWLNSYLGMYMESKVASDFEITGVPALFLVGPDGKLLAQGDDLLGTNLEKTLAKYLDRDKGKAKTGSVK